jgi:hypothetical protein
MTDHTTLELFLRNEPGRSNGNLCPGHDLVDIRENFTGIGVKSGHSHMISTRRRRDWRKRTSWTNNEFH